ncbi:MAG: hypothetical protein ACD_54C00450G0002 [uncultured bacterium]|nr:MAG: hypothetical protein ACD_54C00450G0002 [uncultured bacterium]
MTTRRAVPAQAGTVAESNVIATDSVFAMEKTTSWRRSRLGQLFKGILSLGCPVIWRSRLP